MEAIKQKTELEALIDAEHANPHGFLGIHYNENQWMARCFLQDAQRCFWRCSESGELTELDCLNEHGFFEGQLKGPIKNRLAYVWEILDKAGQKQVICDPYAFPPTLTEEDLYLFNEGTHHRAYTKMGSRFLTLNGIEGVAFALWAPNAKRISIVGDFNRWNGRYLPMRRLGNSGIWELFVPNLKPWTKYKYELLDANGQLRLKSDPYALNFEGPPNNASIICPSFDYQWKDNAWLDKRCKKNWQENPVSIYEVHLDSWRRVVEEANRPLTYRELASELVAYVKTLGFTHVEFLPTAEHPFLGSWGYQVTGFFAPTSRYGTPEDFMYLVDSLHQNDIGVIIDWVPGHFPKDEFALAHFDGTALYEHSDPRKGEHQDWGTLIFNYGRHEVRNFLVGSALSWFDRFHVDGLRVDAVASMLYLDYSRKQDEWIPNQYGGKENIEAIEFLRSINDLVHKYYPGALMIAEESTAFGRVSHPTEAYGLGFDFKWNMGWMHDMLSYCSKDPIHRSYHHHQLTFGMLYQYSENFITVFSHDEVVHGKGSLLSKMGSWFFDDKVSTLKALYGYMWAWPGKKTLFMGSEFGQVAEWNYKQSLDWHLLQYDQHRGIQNLIADLNRLYRHLPFWAKYDPSFNGFEWIDPDDCGNSVISFLRRGETEAETLLIVSNFTPLTRKSYRVGAPFMGHWKEILNTNAEAYGGCNLGNEGGRYTEGYEWHHRPCSLLLCLPPLTTLMFKYEPN